MDLGSMTKKLKGIQYKSKQEFVDDLNLIWANCLKYNGNPDHFLRRHALFMRKETEKLVPLIPAIVIRDRAEVEAEERRQQQADADLDGGEESDEEPIIASRGRKAPGKKTKKGTAPRKAPTAALEGSPAAETKPPLHSLANGLGSHLKNEARRASSENREGSHKDFSTPPPGTHTPAGVNGVVNHDATSVHSDGMDIDSIDSTLNGHGQAAGPAGEAVDHDDAEYKAWKQVTKKDRALVAADRHRLFKGDKINPDEPALLRSKVGMRSWLRKQKQALADGVLGRQRAEAEVTEAEEAVPGAETLAEGIEGEEERMLPDYYNTLGGVPDLSTRTRWKEDSEGKVQDPSEEFLRIMPQGAFVSAESALTKKIADNMRQVQQTRKVCSKIAVVKQMQIQAQVSLEFCLGGDWIF
jgi:transcriptional activator SPT7